MKENCHENCKFGLIEHDQQVLYAAGYLGGQPKLEWVAYKNKLGYLTKLMRSCNGTDFNVWCRKRLSIQNREGGF